MNLNFRRTALLVGICSAVSLTYTPQLFAASVDAIDAVQQAKKITVFLFIIYRYVMMKLDRANIKNIALKSR